MCVFSCVVCVFSAVLYVCFQLCCMCVFSYPDVMMPAYSVSRFYAFFFIVYLSLELYFLMNLASTFCGLMFFKCDQAMTSWLSPGKVKRGWVGWVLQLDGSWLSPGKVERGGPASKSTFSFSAQCAGSVVALISVGFKLQRPVPVLTTLLQWLLSQKPCLQSHCSDIQLCVGVDVCVGVVCIESWEHVHLKNVWALRTCAG